MLTTYQSNNEIDGQDKNDENELNKETETVGNKPETSEQDMQAEEKESVAEVIHESKMSRFMPTLFNSEFSKTYADLLKNVAPLEHRSEATESDYTLYPVLGGEPGRKNIEGGIRIDSKNVTSKGSPLRVSMGMTAKPVD